ncbi:MAG: flavin-binding protein dodecin [Planctomycetota bacterium]|jgi:flavin-binding protein dodecin
MSKTYKQIEIVGTSANSFNEAVRNGIQRASQTA